MLGDSALYTFTTGINISSETRVRATANDVAYSPSLSVTNDELALSAANRHKTVDRLDASLHRLLHRNARNNAGSLNTNASPLRLDRTLHTDGHTNAIVQYAHQTDGHRVMGECLDYSRLQVDF